MPDRRPRALLVSSHPVQANAPVYAELAKHPDVDSLVVYCSLPDPALWKGQEFLNKSAFDIPMLDGYPWTYVPNRALRRSLGSFFGLVNPGLLRLIPRFDCCVVYGYAYASLAMTVLWAKITRRALLMGTDAAYMEPPDGRSWKLPLKRRLLPRILGLADIVLVPSTASRRFVASLGIPDARIALTPYVVDNDSIAVAADATDRSATRAAWGVPDTATVVFFCAKFLPRKRPLDLLQAFAAADDGASYLVLAGVGPLATAMRLETDRLGIADRVRFLGIVPYSQLPAAYASVDLVVVPSSYEPWGLPVNEAMVCGTPVAASDRVGAAEDLIEDGVNGFVYPSGRVDALAEILRRALDSPEQLARMGQLARRRMATWSPSENVEALAQGIARATAIRRGTAAHEVTDLRA